MFECGTFVGARQASIFEAAFLLGFSHTYICGVYRGWFERQFSGQNQRGMARLLQADRKPTANKTTPGATGN